MRTSSAEVLIELDRSRPRGLRAQIEDELRNKIRSGRLTGGTLVPSTRALASDLGVTRGVVVAAYDQLLAEGYLTLAPARAPSSMRPRPVAESLAGSGPGAHHSSSTSSRDAPTSICSLGRRGYGRRAPPCE